MRVITLGKRFQVYLNDEKLPRINVTDEEVLWTNGKVCLGGGWLPAEFTDFQVKPLTQEAKAAFAGVGNLSWSAPLVDKEALRREQRAAYQGVVIECPTVRTNISLDGKWLFMPDYELSDGQKPTATDYDDKSWHVMPVPEFWTPGLSWLHGETGFPDLSGVSKTKGVADNWYVHEVRRADSYTFDWRKTTGAWYRRDLLLTGDTHGRHFVLTFDAIAKVCEILVNGKQVAAHTGLFGQIKCDVTAAMNPGRNEIAVHVLSAVDSSPGNSKVEGVAVTVEVTSKMLHSLPHGMLQDDVGGIWQPVTLSITPSLFVEDCQIEPTLHDADITLDILNAGGPAANVSVKYAIRSLHEPAAIFSYTTNSFSGRPGRTTEIAPEDSISDTEALVTPRTQPLRFLCGPGHQRSDH